MRRRESEFRLSLAKPRTKQIFPLPIARHHFHLSLKYLSESEQFRFGVAFQIALAMVTGLQFVVIDRADVLGKEKRRMLTSLLLNSKFDQAIVLATSEEAPPLIMHQG